MDLSPTTIREWVRRPADQTGFTCSARGPLGPRPSTKETFWPSRKSSYRTPSRFEEWKKISFPPASAMNPNPLSVSFLIVPSGIATSVRCKASGRDVAWVTKQAAQRHQIGEVYQNGPPSTTGRAWASGKGRRLPTRPGTTNTPTGKPSSSL